MGKCAKQKVYFAIKDFFKTNKLALFCSFIALFVGVIVGIAANSPSDDGDIIVNQGRVILWIFITALVPYACIVVSCISKYLAVFLLAAFIFLGVRLGIAIEFLFVCAGFKGFWNLLIIYVPLFAFTYLALNAAIYCCLPYLSSSPNCNTYPNCFKGWRSILLYIALIFAINILICILWILIFGSFVDVIVVISV